jgi:hypothetical protein
VDDPDPGAAGPGMVIFKRVEEISDFFTSLLLLYPKIPARICRFYGALLLP